MLCSPFAYRAYHKPLGYAGDYEMVNMIARDPYEGVPSTPKWSIYGFSVSGHPGRIAIGLRIWLIVYKLKPCV